jgi:hypothetical protein
MQLDIITPSLCWQLEVTWNTKFDALLALLRINIRAKLELLVANGAMNTIALK